MTSVFDGYIAFYPCRDLETTARFYTEALGLTLVRDQGVCRIFRVAARAYVGFCQHQGEMPTHRGVILTFLHDDVDALYKTLTARGVETEGPPGVSERYGIYHLFARDPNGYRLEVQRFLTPLPE